MNFIIGVIDFSLTRFTHPLVIIGLIIALVGVIIVIFAKKIDAAIVKKTSGKKQVNESREAEAFLGKIHGAKDFSTPDETDDEEEVFAEDDTDGGAEKVSKEDKTEVKTSAVFVKNDGTPDYYYIFKIVGLVVVVIGCIMAAFG